MLVMRAPPNGDDAMAQCLTTCPIAGTMPVQCELIYDRPAQYFLGHADCRTIYETVRRCVVSVATGNCAALAPH